MQTFTRRHQQINWVMSCIIRLDPGNAKARERRGHPGLVHGIILDHDESVEEFIHADCLLNLTEAEIVEG